MKAARRAHKALLVVCIGNAFRLGCSPGYCTRPLLLAWVLWLKFLITIDRHLPFVVLKGFQVPTRLRETTALLVMLIALVNRKLVFGEFDISSQSVFNRWHIIGDGHSGTLLKLFFLFLFNLEQRVELYRLLVQFIRDGPIVWQSNASFHTVLVERSLLYDV